MKITLPRLVYLDGYVDAVLPKMQDATLFRAYHPSPAMPLCPNFYANESEMWGKSNCVTRRARVPRRFAEPGWRVGRLRSLPLSWKIESEG
jgi:hypothetical protein